MARGLFIFILFISAFACVGQKKNKANGEEVKEYKEDLNSFRPRYELVEEKKNTTDVKISDALLPKNDINKFLSDKLDSVYFYNRNICCADGFRVLIYVGTSSEEASTYRNNAFDVLPEDKSYKQFLSPNFKVKVGDYIDKLEAYYAYAKLIKIFPNAIVVPDKVNIIRE